MAFQETLSRVVDGTLAVSDYLKTAMENALIDVLLCVARDHSLDYSQLVDDYVDDIVEKHTSVVNPSFGRCKGQTIHKKFCMNQAGGTGYCRKHLNQMATKKQKTSRLEHYVDGLGNDNGLGNDKITQALLKHGYRIPRKAELSMTSEMVLDSL
jgi:hypothetical protein